MKIARTLKEKYYSDNVLLGEWILAAVVGLLIFVSTAYIDLKSLTIWSTNVWDVTFDSNIFQLYEYTAQNVYNVHHQYLGSEFMSILPWSIWNLPIWAIQYFGGIPIIDSPLMLAWSKLFLVLVSLVVLRYTYKITLLLTQDKNKSFFAVFLTASSFYIYTTVCYAGQNDILMIAASLIGVYCLLKGNKKFFLIWSAVAIAIKPFFILPFLAVILLAEKNVLKIMLDAIIGVSGLLIQKIMFMNAPMYAESMESGPASSMLKEMFPHNITTSFGPVSFFAIALVLIYFYSYTRNFNKKSIADNSVLYGKYVIYFIALTYMVYIMFSPFSYYRVAIIIPYIYIVIVQNKKMLMYNVLLDTAMSVTLVLKLVLRATRFWNLRTVNGSIVQGLLGYEVDYTKAGYYASVSDFLREKIDIIDSFQPLFSGVAFICGILLLVLNHPSERIKLPVDGEKCPRVLYWLRALILVPFLVLTLYLFTHTEFRIY